MNGLRLIALYPDRTLAERTVDLLRREGFYGNAVEIREAGSHHIGAEAETRAEAGRLRFGHGILTNLSIGRGLVLGSAIGVAFGAVIGIVAAIAAAPRPSDVGFAIAAMVGGGMAGSVAGTLIGGFRGLEMRRRASERHMTGDAAVVVAPDTDADLARAERIVRQTGPNYLERTMPPHRRAG